MKSGTVRTPVPENYTLKRVVYTDVQCMGGSQKQRNKLELLWLYQFGMSISAPEMMGMLEKKKT